MIMSFDAYLGRFLHVWAVLSTDVERSYRAFGSALTSTRDLNPLKV